MTPPASVAELEAARKRLAEGGYPDELSARQLDVLRSLAAGVATHRGLAAELGISSTYAVAQHLQRLVVRRLIEDRRPGSVCAAPYVLTRAGWCAVGPCICLGRARLAGVVSTMRGRWYIGDAVDAGGGVVVDSTSGDAVHPILFCPWCGRGAP